MILWLEKKLVRSGSRQMRKKYEKRNTRDQNYKKKYYASQGENLSRLRLIDKELKEIEITEFVKTALQNHFDDCLFCLKEPKVCNCVVWQKHLGEISLPGEELDVYLSCDNFKEHREARGISY